MKFLFIGMAFVMLAGQSFCKIHDVEKYGTKHGETQILGKWCRVKGECYMMGGLHRNKNICYPEKYIPGGGVQKVCTF